MARRRKHTRPVYRATTPEDLLNALPAMFGFVPAESIIAVATSGSRNTLGFRLRLDIPGPEHRALVGRVTAAHVDRNSGAPDDGVILIALSADPAAAEEMIWQVKDHLLTSAVLSVWATDHQYWTDLPGFPDEGEPWEWDPAHESVVRAVADGQVILPDRASMVAEFDTAGSPRREWLDAAYEASAAFVGDDPRPVAADLVGRAMAGEMLTDGELLQLTAAVVEPLTRDECWFRLEPDTALTAAELWTRAARVAPEEFGAYPLGLAAFAWWLVGDGARAVTAAERGLDLMPDRTMCSLAWSLLQSGVNPDRWDSIRSFARGESGASGWPRSA